MTGPLPWYPFYPEDFERGETISSASYGGQVAYLRLMNRQWWKESLPKEPAALARMTGMPVKHVREVLSAFPVCDDDRRRNARQAENRREQFARHEAAVRAGRAGGVAKAEAQRRHSDASSHAMPAPRQNGKPRSTNPEPEPYSGTGTDSLKGCGTCIPSGGWIGWNPSTRKICPCALGEWRRAERRAGRLQGGRPVASVIAETAYTCAAGCGEFIGYSKWITHLDDDHGGKAP